jgi:hypothetical protein
MGRTIGGPDGSATSWAAGGSRPELGQKGEAGWAGRDFEPTKPREIKKLYYYFSEFLIQVKLNQIQMNSARTLKLSKQQIKRICRRHKMQQTNIYKA